MTLRIVGSPLSPYVRKVLVFLDLKGLAFELDPIVPFFGGDRFTELSPLRRIPLLIDGELVLSDSSVICQYLEDRHPLPSLYPTDLADRARARWLEEYADTRMGDVFIWRLFNQVAITPAVWGEKGDANLVARTLEVEVPQVLDYLEQQLPSDGYLFGHLSIADISVATFFRNAGFARFTIDAAKWPRSASFVARVLATPPFQKLAVLEDRLVRTPIARHREVLGELGVRLTADTLAVSAPRRGLMAI